jgi:hypothetical protein
MAQIVETFLLVLRSLQLMKDWLALRRADEQSAF